MIDKSLAIGKRQIKRRLALAPMATAKSDNGRVTDEMLAHYDARTKNARFGIAIVEHSFVSEGGMAGINQLSCSRDSDVEGLKRLSDTIKNNGSLSFMQPNHAGAAVPDAIDIKEAISPSGIANPNGIRSGDPLKPSRQMSLDEIKRFVDDYVKAAVRIQKAGFDGLEVHSAHGYLLNQFYSPITNKRKDEYNGDTLEGRIKLHLEIINAVKDVVGKDMVLGVRLGGCDYMDGGSTIEDAVNASVSFQKAGCDFVDISGGMCFFLREGKDEAGYFSDMSAPVKKALDIPVILAGGIKTIDEANQILSSEYCDIASIGRAVLKDPDWGM